MHFFFSDRNQEDNTHLKDDIYIYNEIGDDPKEENIIDKMKDVSSVFGVKATAF